MSHRLFGRSCTAMLSICINGCSLLLHKVPDAELPRTPEARQQTLEDMEAFFSESEASVPRLNPSQLKAGQHLEISTGGVPMPHFPELMIDSTSIAGTVKEASADRVVLQDVVMIRARPTQQAVPIASKVPYFGRLFKNASVIRREVTPVPGEVALERSEILRAEELTETAFEHVRKYGAERMGVDFDFNAAEGGAATSRQL